MNSNMQKMGEDKDLSIMASVELKKLFSYKKVKTNGFGFFFMNRKPLCSFIILTLFVLFSIDK